MNEQVLEIANKEKLQYGSEMVMVVDFDISGVGGAEKSAKAIWRYGEKIEAKWTLISPYDVGDQLTGDLIKVEGNPNSNGDLPQDRVGVRDQVEKLAELLKEKNPKRIILVQPRGQFMNSIVNSLPSNLLPRTAARWGSALDGPIVKKPTESELEFEQRKEAQRIAIKIQADIANKIGVNLAISEAIKKSLIRANVDPTKIKIITNQVGEEYSSEIRRADSQGEFRAKYLAPDELGVLVACRVVRHKGLHWLLTLFSELNQRCLNSDLSGNYFKRIKISLVGDPKDRALLSELQAMENNVGLPASFSYLGPKTSEEMNEIYNTYDILFHPSPSEGGPRVIPESAKGGMMSIARTDCEGANELISSGNDDELQFGLLIDSPQDAAEQIYKLMSSPHLLKHFQTNAQIWATKKFDPERIEQQFWNSLGLTL